MVLSDFNYGLLGNSWSDWRSPGFFGLISDLAANVYLNILPQKLYLELILHWRQLIHAIEKSLPEGCGDEANI